MCAAFFALTALCSCWPLKDTNKIYTIVLDNGKMQRTLKIPGAYLPEKDKDNSIGVWVQFSYPSMKPVVSRTPSEDSIELFIKMDPDKDKSSISEFRLSRLQQSMKTFGGKSSVSHIGKIGIYDVYTDEYKNPDYITKTYFRTDANGNLICIEEVPGLRTSSKKRYSNNIELRYSFSPTLLLTEVAVDSAVTKLVDRWLEN